MTDEATNKWTRVEALLIALRDLHPASVPDSALQALYVHDDTISAIRDLRLTPAERDALPADIESELSALECAFNDDGL